MELTLEALGLSQDRLEEMVVDRAANMLLTGTAVDDDRDDYGDFDGNSHLASELRKLVKARIDERIAAMAEKHVLPNVSKYIEEINLRETNKYGEGKSEPVTFIEYLTQRAGAYLTEQVDYQGKPKGRDSYHWHGTQTRIAHMVHEHLHYSIKTAMENALKVANTQIANGIAATAKLKLAELSKALQVSVETR